MTLFQYRSCKLTRDESKVFKFAQGKSGSFFLIAVMENLPSPASVPDNLLTPKRRITEKKRRLVTNSFFDELVVVLSLMKGSECDNPRKLDKVSILQQTRNLVKFFHNLTVHDTAPPDQNDALKKLPIMSNASIFQLLLETLNGFVLVIMSSGRIVHASNSTISTLGCRPSIVIGQHASSWMHQEDVSNILKPKPTDEGRADTTLKAAPRFSCRFKLQGNYDNSTNMGLSPSQYISYKCSVYNRDCSQEDLELDDHMQATSQSVSSKKPNDNYCVVVVTNSESLAYSDAPIRADESEFCFEMRITKEGKILSISSHSAIVLGFTEAEVIGSSIFDYVNPYHVTAFGQSISMFLQNGYGATNPYRILTKGRQWVWCVTRGFIGCNPWSNEPDHILLHMRVIGTDHVNPQQREWTNFTYLPDKRITPQSEIQVEPRLSSSSTSPKPQTPTTVGNVCTSTSSSSLNEDKMAQRVKVLEKELSTKNAELFESQKRLLEQQNLLGQERKRFFELTETLVKQYNVFQEYQGQPSKYMYPPSLQKWPNPCSTALQQPCIPSTMDVAVPNATYYPSADVVSQEHYFGHEISAENKTQQSLDPVANILSKLLPDGSPSAMPTTTYSTSYVNPLSTDSSSTGPLPYGTMPKNCQLPF